MTVNKLLICGIAGSGKSSLLKYLKSKDLDQFKSAQFYDLDNIIETNIAPISINEFIKSNGIEEFRQIESSCLSKLLESSVSSVIALGGGTVTSELLDELISKKNISIIHLDIPTKNSYKRCVDSDRPLVQMLSESEYIDEMKKRKKILQRVMWRINAMANINAQAHDFLNLLKVIKFFK